MNYELNKDGSLDVHFICPSAHFENVERSLMDGFSILNFYDRRLELEND